MTGLVKITLHGQLGEMFHEEWDFAVKSVSQALNAINTATESKFYQFLGLKEQKGAYYRVLINGEDFIAEKNLDDPEDIDAIKNSNLVAKIDNLKTIDIIPVLEGAKQIFTVILGALLVIAGVVISILSAGIASPLGVALIMVGIGVLAAGITALISKPPAFEDFRDLEGGKSSYLFNGPVNIQREGGPIPVGYGRLLIGSQVISANLSNYDLDASLESEDTGARGHVKTINADKRPVINP